MLHYDVGRKHMWELEDLTAQQRLRCKLKTFICLSEALPHGTDPHPPHRPVIPKETSAHRSEGSADGTGRTANEGSTWHKHPVGWRELRPFGKATFPSLGHYRHSRGGNESSASLCTPAPREVTSSEQERDAGQGSETRALGITAAWKFLYFPMRAPNKNKFLDNLHH